jgi:hypothetical protein
LIYKRILHRTCRSVLSAGVAVTLPSGADADIVSGGAAESSIDNEAVHLQPFIGYLWKPNQCTFVEFFTAADFDANGLAVYDDAGAFEGRLQEQSLLMVDLTVGKWLYRNRCGCCVTGLAPVVELHYTTTMEDTDSVGGWENPFNRMDVLNLTGGVHCQMGPCCTVTVAAGVPLRDKDGDDLYDTELLLQLNRRY